MFLGWKKEKKLVALLCFGHTDRRTSQSDSRACFLNARAGPYMYWKTVSIVFLHSALFRISHVRIKRVDWTSAFFHWQQQQEERPAPTLPRRVFCAECTDYSKYKPLIAPRNPTREPLDLVFFVTSHLGPGADKKRQFVRETWANETFLKPLKTRHVFNMGMFYLWPLWVPLLASHLFIDLNVICLESQAGSSSLWHVIIVGLLPGVLADHFRPQFLWIFATPEAPLCLMGIKSDQALEPSLTF